MRLREGMRFDYLTEYFRFHYQSESLDERLNEMSKNGWELQSLSPVAKANQEGEMTGALNGVFLVFVRQVIDEKQREVQLEILRRRTD